MPRINDNTQATKHFFTKEQLEHFGKELKAAGNYDQLMIAKRAAHKKDGKFIVIQYTNPEDYRRAILVGVYANAPFHTDVPYRFWEQMLSEWREQQNSCKKGQ